MVDCCGIDLSGADQEACCVMWKDEAKCQSNPTVSQSLFTHMGQALHNTNCDFLVGTHKAIAFASALCKAVDETLNIPAHKDLRTLEEIKKSLNAHPDGHTDGPAFVNE